MMVICLIEAETLCNNSENFSEYNAKNSLKIPYCYREKAKTENIPFTYDVIDRVYFKSKIVSLYTDLVNHEVRQV